MTVHRVFATFAAAGILLGRPVPAGAHRLDEYLQARRLSIDVDRISLEIDLTAGVSVAQQVLARMDTNGDGQISTAEGEAYARQMLGAIVLAVDGRAMPVTLVERRFPDLHDMRLGVGIIRLRAASKIPPAASGRHQVFYFNGHQPDASVFLVNALVPDDPRIQIAAQRRDPAQHGLTVDYDVTVRTGWVRVSWLLGGVAMIGVLTTLRAKPWRRSRDQEIRSSFFLFLRNLS